MAIIPYLLYLLLIAFDAVILKDAIAIYGVTINMPVLVVLIVTLYKDDVPAVWFGFFAGLVAAAGGPPGQLGWQALIMAALAAVGSVVRERLNLDSLRARLLVILIGVLLHNLISLALSRSDGWLVYIFSYALAGAVYTSILAWLFFLVKEGRLTAEKIKAIF
jgi:cell shape-determining protein MreD